MWFVLLRILKNLKKKIKKKRQNIKIYVITDTINNDLISEILLFYVEYT